jgi:hypothetical protein
VKAEEERESSRSEQWLRMNSKIQKIELNDGHSIPVLGFGTYATEEVIKKVWGLRA